MGELLVYQRVTTGLLGMISFGVLTVHGLCMTPRGTIWRIAPTFVIETSPTRTCFFPERLGEGRFLGAVSLSSMT